MHRSSRKLLLLAAAAALAVGAAAAPAAAHTELSEGRPGPGQEVGGDIEGVELEFQSPIQDAEIRVFDPEGDEVTGSEHTEVDGLVATQEIEPITEPGEYEVRYTVVAVDNDRQEGAFVFTYDPDAPPLPGEDGGGSTLYLWGFVILSVLILGYGYTRLRKGPDPADEAAD